MLLGYMRMSRVDGSQVLDLQRDALLGAGIPADRSYEDHASGKRDDRPGLEACLKALRKDETLVALATLAKLAGCWRRDDRGGESAAPRIDRCCVIRSVQLRSADWLPENAITRCWN